MKIKTQSLPLVVLASILIALFTLSSCKSYYEVADFNQRTLHHRTVAILPFEMIFTGTKPEKLTDQDVQQIGEAESKAFMISFYNEILRSTKGGRHQIRVDLQHYDKTLSLLKDNNLDIRSSWQEDPGKLAKLLGVDAVVKAHIEKHRLMSDLASYGIDMGLRVINILSDYTIWPWIPGNLAKSNDVKTSFSLLDQNSSVLWSISYDDDADWSRPANELIDQINHKSAKYFPYRKK